MLYMVIKVLYDSTDHKYFGWEVQDLPVEHDKGHGFLTSFADKDDAVAAANAKIEREHKGLTYKTWHKLPRNAKPGKIYLVIESGNFKTYYVIVGVK